VRFSGCSGLHRTYIGQIERGEKNISFENLSKVAGVLGVTLSDLLSGLEDGRAMGEASKRSLIPAPLTWANSSCDHFLAARRSWTRLPKSTSRSFTYQESGTSGAPTKEW